ncbi:hypothetical protein J5N97_002416 [Dioscorea zingiberensis]|uniref:Uncharacterized protein n=1 Tax=Dioscorea zingiberensis TaxID=325984 RepID=A0A9D5HP67_9LILI|nr:hypothetical protein J5N97_002416 [Dioscorea zingiberensis]
MRKLWPNLDREDGLDTVLEVPIPEEMLSSNANSKSAWSRCTNMVSWMRSDHRSPTPPLGRNAELQLMLGVVGAPLVPLPVQTPHRSFIKTDIKDDPIEVSMAKYIVQQYVAAAGGMQALESIDSMYAMGKVKMVMASELKTGSNNGGNNRKGILKGTGGEMGGFVLWKKKPDLWCLELVVSGCKISAGSDGKLAWRQTPWHQSHASRGPPRPLRRSLQGLDPRSTANLFSNSVCIGEKTVNGDACFVLRIDAEAAALRTRSSSNVEIIRHTVWGYFSQRTGLLVQLEDSHLLRIKAGNEESVYWETTMESVIEDYRPIDGVNIAHSGRTTVSLSRFGNANNEHTKTRVEEVWTVEEVDFNIWGLSTDCFLPPSDLKEDVEAGDMLVKNSRPSSRVQASAVKIGASKVAAVNIDDSDLTGGLS